MQGHSRYCPKWGVVAYRLELSPTVKVHPMFHVLVLKRKVGPITTVSSSLPEFDEDGKLILHPMKVLARRLVKQGNSPATQLWCNGLICLSKKPPLSSWGMFRQGFLNSCLEDKIKPRGKQC